MSGFVKVRTGHGQREYEWIDAARVVAIRFRERGMAVVLMEDRTVQTIEDPDELVEYVERVRNGEGEGPRSSRTR